MHQTFAADTLFVALYDQATNMIRFPYEIGGGERVRTEPIEPGKGLTSRVVESRLPLRFGSTAESQAHEAIDVGGYQTES